jgi:hypothetical protein
METIKLWARHGDAVRRAMELGELVHLDTASEELTDEFLLFAIESGLLTSWATSFPDPRQEPEIGMEVILASHLAARFAGLYSMRKSGYVLRSAAVLGALGYSVEVLEPAQGLSLRGTSDDKLISGDVLRKLLVQLNWLQVLGTTELAKIYQRVCQQLHAIMPLLYTFKSQQQSFELIFPCKGPLDTHV